MNTPEPKFYRSDLKYFAISLIPLLLILGLVAASLISWGLNQQKLRQRIAASQSLKDATQAGYSVSAYESATSKEQTERWKRILDAGDYLSGRPYMALIKKQEDDEYQLVPQGDDWVLAAPVERLATEAEPVLAEIDLLLNEVDKPIWLPIQFSGYSTLLPEVQESRNIATLVRHDFQNAFHQGDTDRAMKDLQRLELFFGDALVEPQYIVTCLARQASQRIRFELIRKSLAHEFWTEPQLEQLDKMLARPFDADRAWQGAILSEANEAFHLAGQHRFADGGDSKAFAKDWISPAPSGLLTYVAHIEKIAQTQNVGTLQHVRNVMDINAEFFRRQGRSDSSLGSTDRLVQMPIVDAAQFFNNLMPSFEVVARQFMNLAGERRWTRTAVALKRYQVKFGEFPDSLEALSKLNYPKNETEDINRSSFLMQNIATSTGEPQANLIRIRASLNEVEPLRVEALHEDQIAIIR